MRHLACSLALALACGPLMAQEASYGPRLEGFDYPYPVKTYAFTSQQQALEMAYLDVAPTGKANGAPPCCCTARTSAPPPGSKPSPH